MTIHRLIHLVQRKNDINRRRRRFYYYMRHYPVLTRTEEQIKHISQREAIAGYEKGKLDMKAMTPIMREIRKEIGARFIWDARGAIIRVEHAGDFIEHKDFKRYSDDYLAERMLLGI
jgi:hypothetical protein